MVQLVAIKCCFKNYRQILAVFIISISMMMYGLLTAWPSPSIAILIQEDHPLHITYEQASYFTVLPPIATVLAAIPTAILVDKKGPKFTLLFGTIPYFFSWVLIDIGNSVWVFYASRLIAGIGDACIVSASLIYLGEVTDPKVRDKWGNLLMFQMYLGMLLAYALGGYLEISTTANILVAFPVLNFVLLCCLPESPYFLIMRGRNDEAKQALQWLRQGHDYIDIEFNEITEAVKRQISESGNYKDIFIIPSNRKAIIVVSFARLAQQFSGTTAFLVYAQTFFVMAGSKYSSTTSALICSVIRLLFSVVGAIVVEKLGKRIAMLLSTIGCTFVLISMTIYFYLDTNTNVDVSMVSWFPLVGMIAYLIIFSLGLSLVPTLISSEMFSSSVKGKSMAIINIVLAVSVATTSKIFQVLSGFGLFAPLLFFAVTCFIFGVISYYMTPETKGKTLDEIQKDFKAQ